MNWRGIKPVERLRRQYAVAENGCWEWTGSLNLGGYGAMTLNGRRIMAHRAAYVLLVGPIPDGLDLDHLCRNRRCVNPDHLEPVTRGENLRRGVGVGVWNRLTDQCPQGHPYDETNTYQDPRGWRGCRACRNEAYIRYRSKAS